MNGKPQQTISMKLVNGSSIDAIEWVLHRPSFQYRNQKIGTKIGSLWLKQGEAEHSSIASFAKNTLQLLSIGAPNELLIASQKASVDELHHTKISYLLSREFMKKYFCPGTLDIKDSLESGNVNQMIKSTIHEGCIEETVSAVEAHYNARASKITDIRKMVFNI